LDPSPAPWRAFETGDSADGSDAGGHSARAGDRGMGGSAHRADRDDGSGSPVGLAIPVWWIVGGIAVALFVASAAAFLLLTAPRPSTSLDGVGAAPSGQPDASAAPSPSGLVVEVAGAVLHPGIYRLPIGSRIADAITAAGGYSARVDAAAADRSLNLAHPIADGDSVRVPSRDDPATANGATGGGSSGGSFAPGGTGSGSATTGPIDLNTATAEQLDTLPGIGPVTAAKIVASRQTGLFKSVNDLQTRKLVGPATFAKLRALVTVR
jgi:competence protein ComEA